MGFIYKVTNKENGMVYIGQTRRAIPIRWKQHLECARGKRTRHRSKLYDAMMEFGVDCFIVEQVEECPVEKLNEREKYWIAYYNSCKDGYNTKPGGNGVPSNYSDKEIYMLWKQGYTIKRITEELNLGYGTASRRLRFMGVDPKKISRRGYYASGGKDSKSVYQYDIDGNYIRSYSSIKEVQRESGIRVRLPPKYKTSAGYQWRLYKADKIESIREELENFQYNPRPVHRYTFEGEYVDSFSSVYQATKKVGKPREANQIIRVCNGESAYAYGYRWSFEKTDRLPENKYLNRKIVRITIPTGEYKIYNSVAEASRENHINDSKISQSIHKRKRLAGGYKWQRLCDTVFPIVVDPVLIGQPNFKPMEVHQYTMDGEYVQSFESIGKAAKFHGAKSPGSIYQVVAGKGKTYNGFRWSFEKYDKLPLCT